MPTVPLANSSDRALDRLFTLDELRLMACAPGDLASEAIMRGDVARARSICAESKDMQRPLHDNYSIWHIQTLAYILREYGLETLHEALRESISPWLRPIAETFRNGVTREGVAGIAQIWRMFCLSFGPVEEDDAVITMTLAGYGASFSADQHSKLRFGATEDGAAADYVAITLAAMHRSGGTEPRVPLFAAALLHAEALMTEWLGYPPFVIDFHADGAPARLLIYKDPSAIPQPYFDRIDAKRDARRIRGAIAVPGGRLFSDAERADLALQYVERAVAALDAGDVQLAQGHCQLSKAEWYPGHHIHRDWITGVLSFVYRRFGVDAVYACVWRAYNEPFMVPMLDSVGQLDLRGQVEALASGFRQHAMAFRIEEYEDRFVFVTEPCGSGGRLLDEGAYQFPKNFARIKEKHKAGFFIEDFPVYCIHCPSANELVMQQGGPYYLMVDGDLMTVPDGNCNFYIFKNPEAVPDRFYRRAGLDRSACGTGCSRG